MAQNSNGSNEGSVIIAKENAIGTITFFHPKGNSLPRELLTKLAHSIDTLSKDPEVKVLILQSKGDKIFCAGASFDELLAAESIAQSENFFSGFAEVLLAMNNCSKFIIGRIQGKAIGGGVGIIAGCDYVLALNSASVRLSELSIGFGPFIIGPVVEKKIGQANFKHMTIDTEWRDSAWCVSAGLFSNTYPSVDLLDQAIQDLCQKLSTHNPEAILALKNIFCENTTSLQELLSKRVKETAKLALTPFVREKVKSFQKSS